MRTDVSTGGVDDDDADDSVDHTPSNMASHYQSAYEKGAIAYREGKNPQDCPYRDIRNTSCFGTSWSRVWRKVWFLGYDNEQRKQNDDDLKPYRKGPWQ